MKYSLFLDNLAFLILGEAIALYGDRVLNVLLGLRHQ